MKNAALENYVLTELKNTTDRLARVQAAIAALHPKQDHDVLEALLVARAYLYGAQTTLEMACIIGRV